MRVANMQNTKNAKYWTECGKASISSIFGENAKCLSFFGRHFGYYLL